MRILLIGNKFFGYTERLKQYIEETHVIDVIYIYMPSKKERIFKKLGIKCKGAATHYKKAIDDLAIEYDRILVFGGGAPYFFIDSIKRKYRRANLTLYLSADMNSYKFSANYISLFDKVFTYSLNDAKEYGFIYRPWFFTHVKESAKKIDVSFVGTIHPSRLKILLWFSQLRKIKLFLYIYTDRLSYLRQAVKWRSLKDFIFFKGLQYGDYINVLSSSVATLDIPDETQTNITTRPIESLGTKTKVITTNTFVGRYNFYNENNILILHKNTSEEEVISWLKKPYVSIESGLLSYYSIETWCNEVLM